MAVARFSAKVLVEKDGRRYRLQRQVADAVWIAEDQVTYRIVEFPMAELQRDYANGSLRFVLQENPNPRGAGKKNLEPALALLHPEAFKLAKLRRAYVEAVIDKPTSKRHCQAVIEKVWQRLKEPETCPSFQSVARWKRTYIQAQRDIASLMNDVGGNHTARIDSTITNLVQQSIDEIYMTIQRKTIQDTLDDVLLKVEQENILRPAQDQLKAPTFSYVSRQIQAIAAFDRDAARYGLAYAQRKYRCVLNKKTAERPLERAEIDHTKLDLFVVDERTGLPCGRPYLTVCIDVCTRCILGVYVGFEPPSSLTVARCLRHALMPKAGLHEAFPQLKFGWDAHGVMTTLVVDNGLEFHSEALELACYSLGTNIEYCPRAAPWLKPHIERFIGSANRGIAHKTPGTTFSNIFDKADYDPEKHATITLSRLRQLVTMWAVDYYQQRTHRSLQTSPAAMWAGMIKPEEIPVPADPSALDAILGRPERRKLTHAGISIDGLPYNLPDLNEIRRRIGPKVDVDVRVDDGDLSEIIVLRPDNSGFVRVPCLLKDYARGLSRWQHAVCKRYAANHFPNPTAPEAWARAKAAIAALIAEERSANRQRRRDSARAQRWIENDPTGPSKPAPAATAVPRPPTVPALPSTAPVAAAPAPAEPIKPRRFAAVQEQTPFHDVERSL